MSGFVPSTVQGRGHKSDRTKSPLTVLSASRGTGRTYRGKRRQGECGETGKPGPGGNSCYFRYASGRVRNEACKCFRWTEQKKGLCVLEEKEDK